MLDLDVEGDFAFRVGHYVAVFGCKSIILYHLKQLKNVFCQFGERTGETPLDLI